MDPRLEKLMKDTVHFLKEDLEEENLSYACQLKKDWLIKTIQHVWNETKYDVSINCHIVKHCPQTLGLKAP